MAAVTRPRYYVAQRGVAEAVAISRLRDQFQVEIRGAHNWSPDPRAKAPSGTAPQGRKPKRRRGRGLW